MSNFADFNVGTLNLHDIGETTKLTGKDVITTSLTVSWTDLVSTIQNIDEIEQEILLKEDISNKSTDVLTDASSETKYPSVKSVKTYVDARISEQNQFVDTTLQTLQLLQDGLTNSNQVDTTKEDIANKSTSILTDAGSNTKYPSVKAIKDYVDSKATSCFLVFEGESNLANKILWSIPEVFLPYYGKIHRITGITYGNIENMNSIDIQLKSYKIENTSHSEPFLVRNIPMLKHPTLEKMWVVDINESDILISEGGHILSLDNTSAKNIEGSSISIPPYVKFFITIEYQTQF